MIIAGMQRSQGRASDVLNVSGYIKDTKDIKDLNRVLLTP